MPVQSSGQITTTDIANEFGYSRGSTNGIRIGDYRGQGFTNPNETTVRIPTSENVTTDLNGSVRFSDFYGGRLTLVVNYFSAAAELKPGDAYGRFTSVTNKTVVGNDTFGGFKPFTSNNTAGKRVVILVNEDIGSDKVANDSCALRTGDADNGTGNGWNADTVMQILVGPDGEILGAGGNGGYNGLGSFSGRRFTGRQPGAGSPGSSGLGIQFEGIGGTKVTVQPGGRIAGGAGGGGGGGGAFVEDEERGGGTTARSDGGFGGGGAGYPAGTFYTGAASPPAGKTNAGNATGGGGTQSAERSSATGGAGGVGGTIVGSVVNSGAGGVDGSISGNYERWPRHRGTGAAGGAPGAAIRRKSGMNSIIIEQFGQVAGDTSATGIT